MMEKIQQILTFWFGRDKQNYLANAHSWFDKDPSRDKTIKEQFEPTLLLASKGLLDSWMSSPQSCLALIVLCDQFSRNMFRDTPSAFAQDAKALEAFEKGRAHKLDKELHFVQRTFFYMPLMHSEELAHQKLAVALYSQLVEEVQPFQQYAKAMEQSLHFARQHLDIIQNFGRFPHRNAILDRESTQEEMVFLTLPNSSF